MTKDYEIHQDEEVKEVDVMEISLTEDEISEWIEKLEELKESKDEIELVADDNNELVIKYMENTEDYSDGGKDDEE